MLDKSTIEKLRGMNLSAFAAELERQMSDSSFSQMAFEDRLGLLVDSEWNRRRNNKLNRLIKRAAFSTPSATVEGIEYIEDRHLDKKQILRFAACSYIDEGHHIILKGASGNGKTYLSCALGNAACRKFKTVRYIRTPELLDELSIAKANGELKDTIKAYAKLDLLILNEWLIRKLSYNEAYALLEIVEARENRSMIFCTQYETEGWYNRIHPDEDTDSPISEAIMDRIIRNSYIMAIDGKCSMRERHGLITEVSP